MAAKPAASVPGFLVGGLVWFAIPFCLATTLGLACAALELPISIEEVNAGLPAPKAVEAMLGDPGDVGFLLMLIMAVSSTGSAELIAIASIFTYDIYSERFRSHLKQMADKNRERLLQRISKRFIILFGLLMGLLGMGLKQLGVTLNYTYLLMGVLIGSAVAPCIFCVLWQKISGQGAIAGLVGGFIFGVGSFLGSAARQNNGVISLETTGQDRPLLVGNLSSLFSSLFLTILFSWVYPSEPCPWTELNEKIPAQVNASSLAEQKMSEAEYRRYERIASWFGIGGSLLLIIVWPIPMFLSGYIFSETFFVSWVCLCCLWSLLASAIIIVYPLRDAHALMKKAHTDALQQSVPQSSLHYDDGVELQPADFVKGRSYSPH